MHDGEDCLGDTTSEMNFSAEDLEDEDAAAVTVCLISWTSRVEGAIRRSLVKVRAMPPVAMEEVSHTIFRDWGPGQLTHDAPTDVCDFRHCVKRVKVGGQR